MDRVFIGLGSNLGHRGRNVSKAITMLSRPFLKVQLVSSIYETLPVGAPLGSRPFLNAVLSAETSLTPTLLLNFLQGIEIRFGRVWHESNAPRLIDLDILLYGESTVCTDKLVIPHPKLLERPFVLFPLAEIATNFLPSSVRKGMVGLDKGWREPNQFQIRKIPNSEISPC